MPSKNTRRFPFFRFIKTLCWALAIPIFLATQASAALPDPVAFSWAIEVGDTKKIKAWLDDGLDPEFQGSQIGTGLMQAAWHGKIDIMQLFLERGANPRRANRNGEQPIQLAAWNGHIDAVKFLLSHGTTVNREGKNWSALHYAVFNGHVDLAKYLVSQGASVNATSPNGSTPLMLAAREGNDVLAKWLLESGADTQTKNDWGDTALTMAMRYDHYQLGKIISTQEEFDLAVKTPKENFGEASRSGAAPQTIEELLAKIRESEAGGRSSAGLKTQLAKEVNTLGRPVLAQGNTRRTAMPRPYQPKSMLITAKRGSPGAERAQIVPRGKSAPAAPSSASSASKKNAASIVITRVDRRATQAKIAEIMRQIRLAEAEGQATDQLNSALTELVDSLK